MDDNGSVSHINADTLHTKNEHLKRVLKWLGHDMYLTKLYFALLYRMLEALKPERLF